MERFQARDATKQAGCDFDFGIRVVLGTGLGFGKEKLLAAASPEEQNAWGGAFLACRKGVLQVPSRPPIRKWGRALLACMV